MPHQTAYSLQRASSAGDSLKVTNELYEYLGLEKTPYYIAMINRGAFKRIIPLLDESWDIVNMAQLQFTVDTEKYLAAQMDKSAANIENTEVLNFSFLSDTSHKIITDLLSGNDDYTTVKINSYSVLSVNMSALAKLKQDHRFAHIKAFVITCPIPKDTKTLLNLLVITDPSIIVDIMNISDVDQPIEISFPDVGEYAHSSDMATIETAHKL